LMFGISTSGYDRHSLLWELYDYACKVRDGILTDETFLPVIYEAPKEADWLDERVWRAANPALGDFRSLEEMQIAARRAKEIPAQENAFRRLYLNQWTEQADRWLPMHLWDACKEPIDWSEFGGRTCYVGMDLSSTRDLTALVAVFPDGDGWFDVLPCFFVPRDTLAERTRRDRVPYDLWEKQGHLVVTNGNVVDYEAVRAKLHEWAKMFDLKEIAFDPWNARDLVSRLTETDGFTCIEIRQGYASLSGPTKGLEKAVVGRMLRHDGHPVLRWNISNVAIEQDPSGNIKLSKKVSTERIDGAAALVNAVDRMERNSGQAPPVTVLAEWV
jgi:phage terminase large subunit-like protein